MFIFMTMSVVVFTLSSIKFSSVQDAWKPVYRPNANTCSSQKFICPMTGNCTITYLYAGRFRSQNRETVAPSGTAPGYWPHSVYDHSVTTPGREFVKPTMKLFDLWCSAQTTHIAVFQGRRSEISNRRLLSFLTVHKTINEMAGSVSGDFFERTRRHTYIIYT